MALEELEKYVTGPAIYCQSAPVFPSQVTSPLKRKSTDSILLSTDDREYEPYEMYNLSLTKLMKAPACSKRAEMSLNKSVLIRNMMKHLEHEMALFSGQDFLAGLPPCKQPKFDDCLIGGEQNNDDAINVACNNMDSCQNNTNAWSKPLFPYGDFDGPLFDCLPSSVLSTEMDIDLPDLGNVTMTELTSATLFEGTEYRALSSCAYDHRLHKENNQEDLEHYMQVLA